MESQRVDGRRTGPGGDTLTELVDVPGGRFRMGSEDFYPDEGPVRVVDVAPFALERHPVTNAQFAAFVEATGHVTTAEQPPDPRFYPGADPAMLVPGGLVFTPTPGPVRLDRWDQWWRWVPGASWRHPRGPGSDIVDRDDHPVVLVSYDDAVAYAEWAGRRLPTETELEYASRGGAPETTYAWGEEPRPGGRLMANTWQGRFPYRNTGADGWVGTSPVGTFPPNGYGLVDLIGNVWEWTSTYYVVGPDREAADALDAPQQAPPQHGGSCCAPAVSLVVGAAPTHAAPSEHDLARASTAPGEAYPRRVLKGGSHLCAPEYCLRYRPAARSPQSVDSATTHIGFRCAVTR